MINFKQIVPCLAMSAAVASCMQSPQGQTDNTGVANKPIDVEVPQGFDWKTTQDISITGDVDDQYNGRYEYRVNFYAENPVINPNALLIKGVSTKSSVKIDITIPKGLAKIYVCQIDPLSRRLVQSVPVGGNSASFNFKPNTSSPSLKTRGERGRIASSVTIPSTPGDAIALSGSSKIKLETGANYVIRKGSTFDGDVTFPGEGSVNLFVEGVWNIGKGNMSLQTGTNIIVQSTGLIKGDEDAKINVIHDASLQIAFGGKIETEELEIHLTDSEASIINLGNVSLDGIYYSNNGKLINQGTLKIDEELKSSNGTVIINDGTIIVENVNFIGGDITNNGTMEVGELDMNSNKAVFTNNSVLVIEESADLQNTTFNNNCSVEFKGDIEFELKGSVLNNANNTYFSCYNMDVFSSKINLGEKSIFEVRNEVETQNGTTINGAGKTQSLARLNKVEAKNWEAIIYNNVQVETAKHTQNGQWSNYYVLNDNSNMVEWGKSTVSIPANECTGKGNTPDQGTGSEGDQNEDVIYNQVYTYLLEDNWPSLGDYDMNDAVIELTSYKESVKNKSIVFNFRLINIGASKEIGAGIQLDGIVSSQINRVVSSIGGVVEDNQRNVVIPLFSNGHSLLGAAAGKPTNGVSPKDISVEVVFNNANDVTAFKVSSLNLFITTSDKVNVDRRKEIHLCGYAPTDKAETALFGKNDDNSLVKTYQSKSNYVWGIMIPANFAYPKEAVNISRAYTDFAGWISSGGAQNQDWYENPSKDNVVPML